MPELPEVETLVAQLREKISGCVLSRIVITRESILSSPKEAITKKLSGKRVQTVKRRGKFIRLEFEKDLTLWFHLGMTGQLIWTEEREKKALHQHLALVFEGKKDRLLFRDSRRFGEVFLANGNIASLPQGVRLLGPEPFEISGNEFASIFGSRKGRIKSLLLNQRLMAGLGNIYADESLYRAGINPKKRPHRLNRTALMRLHESICLTLKEAIRHGGSSIDDYMHLDGGRGVFQKFHQVYGREGENCNGCGTKIRRVPLAGRSSHFCPQCQK